MVGAIGSCIAMMFALLLWCLWHDSLRDKRLDALEAESLILARAIKAHTSRIDDAEKDSKQAIEIALDYQKSLTEEPAKPKIVPKPVAKRVNWRQAQAALERASEPEREES